MEELKDRVALITGTSSGIDATLARELAQQIVQAIAKEKREIFLTSSANLV